MAIAAIKDVGEGGTLTTETRPVKVTVKNSSASPFKLPLSQKFFGRVLFSGFWGLHFYLLYDP
jgi:hypothetical protein